MNTYEHIKPALGEGLDANHYKVNRLELQRLCAEMDWERYAEIQKLRDEVAAAWQECKEQTDIAQRYANKAFNLEKQLAEMRGE